ncbi:MAG: hypothetical protein ACI36X_07990 [Bacteroidaceae bacterium]
MRRIRYNQLPDDWTAPQRLSRCEIFVFESTLEGEHTEGNAKIAYERFGAEWGVGAGRRGQTYAIPTNFMSVEEDFEPFVQDFIEYVKAHPDNRFILPRMECKGAVFYEKDIIPLFEECFDLPNVQMSHAWDMRIITLRTIDAMAGGYVKRDIPEPPKVMDEEVLANLCLQYRYQIGSGVTSRLPKIRIRYVIDRNQFGYASFGDFFMTGCQDYYELYVWMQDDKYAELHNQDVVEGYFGDECHGRGYAVRMIFAGVDTNIKDVNKQNIFTGDVIDVEYGNNQMGALALALHPSAKDLHGGYAFPLDNHSLIINKENKNQLKLERCGTVFFQLNKTEKSKTIWERSLCFNGPYDTPEQHATKALMARYTPNFDKEEWKYEGLAELGAEFHWEK